MTPSLQALCTDFYVNQKIALKLDVPRRRETVLDMFDRVRREMPSMDRMRRYEDELALESPEEDAQYSWIAMRKTSIRSGWVNPDALHKAYRLHQLILEIAPYFLSISPLDVDYLELVFGFDIAAETNRNSIVFEALLADSPLAGLVEGAGEEILDAQPFVGFSLNAGCDLQAFVEIKTRTSTAEIVRGHYQDQPISFYLTVRKYGPLQTLDAFASSFGTLAGHIERLAESRVIPCVVVPIRQAIMGV
jgi:hypothetical protein